MSAPAEAQAAELRRQLAANPRDRVAWHNLAALAGDLGRAEEAERAARQAIALGIPAPETRLVLARALQALRRLDEAESMFEEALRLRPTYAEAHRDLAQLRWMVTGRAEPALQALDSALQRAPGDPGLHLVRSVVLEFAGRTTQALESARAALAAAPDSPDLLRQATHLCAATGDAAQALRFARRAHDLAPNDSRTAISLCEALLAAGLAREAESVADQLQKTYPLDQHAVALRATAWRLLGDSRYESLYDYARLVRSVRIETPRGWSSLEAFLGDLARALDEMHAFKEHPFQQSVRGGSQLPITQAERARPEVRALFSSLERAASEHLRALGAGSDPFTARNTGRAAITGAWSVRLHSGGYHTDHVHQRGWLSSAFYVTLPPDMARASPRAGWLRLGKPGLATQPALQPDFFLEPQAGHLALFPAYVWHGVEPFESERPRLTVAFDALPA